MSDDPIRIIQWGPKGFRKDQPVARCQDCHRLVTVAMGKLVLHGTMPYDEAAPRSPRCPGSVTRVAPRRRRKV